MRKAKTHKGRKYLENLKPKLIEDEKKTLFMRGKKEGDHSGDFYSDLVFLSVILVCLKERLLKEVEQQTAYSSF